MSLTAIHGLLDERQFGFELDGLAPSRGNNPVPEDLAVHCTCLKCEAGSQMSTPQIRNTLLYILNLSK